MQQCFELYRVIPMWQTEGGTSYRGEQELAYQVYWLTNRRNDRLLATVSEEPFIVFPTEVSCSGFHNTRCGKCIPMSTLC